MKTTKRENTRRIKIGNLYIGGSNNVLIQSMCNIKTSRVNEVVEQINCCQKLGADMMRVSILDEEDAKAIKAIKEQISIPLIGDIHFSKRLAILAIENGIDKIRLNPGNITNEDDIAEILVKAKEKHIAIRVGVNGGSLEKSLLVKDKKINAKKLVLSAKKLVDILEKHNFYDIVVSIKGSDVLETIEAYRIAAKTFPYPLHIGITEAGIKDVGLIRSVAGLAPLLLEGIGDTIRISLSEDPKEEVLACRRLLKDLKIRTDFPCFISCPTCGRTEVNLIPLAHIIEKFLVDNKINLTIAIMGCIVNGPGEGAQADIGVAGGKGCWLLFKNGKAEYTIPDKDVERVLKEEILNLWNKKQKN